MITLNEKEKKKVTIIKKVISKEISCKQSALELEVSTRQISRLKKIYLEKGEEGFIHKSRGKQSDKEIPINVKEEIVNLYLLEYYDYNFTHFYEEIKDRFDVSYRMVCSILNEYDIISPEAQHKTVRLYNEKMRKAIKENKISKEQETFYKRRATQIC